MKPTKFTTAVVLFLAGCGAAASSRAPEPVAAETTAGSHEPVAGAQTQPGAEPTVQESYDELTSFSAEFDRTLELATIDCESARNLRDRICELSARICGIAEENPADLPTAERCEDGSTRCESASERVASSCDS
ncbi:MAG: hypothetical protein AAGE52_05550 [Myxococcota bacterium]